MTNVLITYPGMIPSVLLCGQYQLEYLAKTGKIKLRSISRKALTSEDCGWADVVFLVRSDSELEVALAKKWKCAGKRLVYVLDDDLLNVPSSISSSGFYSLTCVQKSIQELITLCDVFLSPSEKLREKYGWNKSAPIEEPAVKHPAKAPRRSGPVRVGFAGSIDRAGDLDTLLNEVIGALIERYKEHISIEFFGAHPKIADTNALRSIPYCDSYDEYQRMMEELDWDIGIAPMPNTPFHACKHYNKFIEYAKYGIAGVYSETEPYTRIVSDGDNGLLCSNTPEDWELTISRLIDDATLREHIAKTAQHQVESEFSVEVTALALEKELGGLLTYISPDHRAIWIPTLVQIKISVRRAVLALQRYGLRTPAVAVKKLREKLVK